MSLRKRIGFGCTLSVDLAGGTNWTVLGNIVKGMEGPDCTSEIVDVTVLTDQFKDKMKGTLDGGTFTFDIAYDPDDPHSVLFGDGFLQVDPIPAWLITYPLGTTPTETFRGIVSRLGRSIQKDGFLVAPITVEVVGDPGFTRT